MAANRPTPAHLTGSFDDDVAPLRPELYRYAVGLTRNSPDAEDLVQDTMLKAFKAYDKLRAETFVKAWLFTIMRNTWFSSCRASKRRPELLVADMTDVDHRPTAADTHGSSSAELEVLRDEIDPELMAALGGLSEEMRATVFHVVVGDMLCRDAAELLGVSTNTVLTRMHRSRHALRRALADRPEGQHPRRAA
ncbi:RNA polymerase sigma factor [Mycolicibacterium sp. P1-18]|uniref:RNA polymerase sigma factor n=1 Tax=Mycolicibacterium sp. P1-18 TaxID=2024615 RepID=UPI0011F0C938|nr:RNA polymerase sigma factor [Mycolicibacterium sp. P1-18]KAA0101117.1 RNA polymerase sigma factor [Mycolicibacterium sp. P1-18]